MYQGKIEISHVSVHACTHMHMFIPLLSPIVLIIAYLVLQEAVECVVIRAAEDLLAHQHATEQKHS